MPQQPAVTLTNEERTALENFVHRGKANARTLTCARILLKSADGWSTAALALVLGWPSLKTGLRQHSSCDPIVCHEEFRVLR